MRICQMSLGRDKKKKDLRDVRCEQEAEERVEEGLEEESGELKAEKSNINNEDMLESGQTNIQSTS